MVKVTLEVPEDVARLLKAMEKKLQREARVAKAFGEIDPEGALGAIDEAADALARDAKRRLLRDYDCDASHVRVGGKRYARAGRHTATYKTRQGPVEVERTLYRPAGERGEGVRCTDVVAERLGCVGDGWLPEAAAAMAHLLACGTPREAESTARALKVLPYSDSSFGRVGHEVGVLYGKVREKVEAALADVLEVPEGAASVSVSMDRVALPMEEPKARPVGRPRRGAPRRPVDVVFRMAYVGCLTFHDAQGEGLSSLRYGRMPALAAEEVARRLALDVEAVLRRKPTLRVVVLTDGAPELHTLLDEALATHAPSARDVVRLLDFWHLMEKLGAAALLLAAGAQEAAALREKWKLALLNQEGAVWKLVGQLDASGKREVRVGEGRPVHEALTYLENHGERMHYAEARTAGLPIGSGNVEAACKSLVAVRMKRPGSRWKEATGQHVLDLRSLVLSERWQKAMVLTLEPLKRRVRRAA
jgi:hypothetical protein